ncbi:MAG: hypothetical protein IJ149_04795 [Oscillospiraceae bacterium]|nr:hypothetical protein [Oscillospiraceae bacterium]
MPAHKRKPNYNGATTMQELLAAVCDYYGDPVDDRNSEDPDHVSLHDVADRFNITVMKARKLLITGGLYSTAISRRVQELHAQGLTVAQITEETGLKRASINSYLPYAHIIDKWTVFNALVARLTGKLAGFTACFLKYICRIRVRQFEQRPAGQVCLLFNCF